MRKIDHCLGYFRSAQIHDETISTACISADSKIVLTGDSTGFVKLWHVSKFLESESSNETLTPDQCICDCHDLGINHADFSPSMNISGITEVNLNPRVSLF